MFWKYVLEPQMILQLTCYNIGYFIEYSSCKILSLKINITFSESCTFFSENSETILHVLCKMYENFTVMKYTECTFILGLLQKSWLTLV